MSPTVILGYLVGLAGIIVALVGEVRLLAMAYRHGPGWLFGCLACPPLWAVLLVCHFVTMRRAFFFTAVGWVAFVVGCWMAGVEL